jgi:hypothetical protein
MVDEDRLTAASWGGEPASRSPGISEARSREYYSLLQRAGGIKISARRGSAVEERIQFGMTMSFSLACGYAYSRVDLAPQLESLDKGRGNWRRNVSYYRKIEGNWNLECAMVDD